MNQYSKSGYDPVASFWAKVDKTGSDGRFTWNGTPCWMWLAARDRHGYGKASSGVRSRFIRAHRRSWMLTKGPIPDGVNVLHHCDNPPCVNSDHHFLGSRKDNSRDMASKGRQGRQKILLKEHDTVRHLVSVGIPARQVAKMYGVTYGAIWFILHPEYKTSHYKRRTA